MDINVALNVNFSGNQIPVLPPKEDSIAKEAEKPREEEVKRPKVEEKVMMDLKDVQNFLYMLIGAEIKVKDENFAGDSLNLSA